MKEVFTRDPQVLYPPVIGDIFIDGNPHIISICGPTHGILTCHTWHQDMIRLLKASGYEEKIYIPCRLDAYMNDYSPHNLFSEDRNNEKVFFLSSAFIYWQPEDMEVDILNYTRLLLEWSKTYYGIKNGRKHLPQVLFGAEKASSLARSLAMHHVAIKLHESMEEICETLFKTQMSSSPQCS